MRYNAKKRLESRMLGNLHVRFGVGVRVQSPGLHHEVAEEIYEIRKKICEECDYDFKKLGERFRKRQEEHPELLVRHVPKTDSSEDCIE